MVIKADFHLHSCLSPCGDLSMSPSYIVQTLQEKGIQLAALTDHNSALNCPAFAIACKKAGIAALYGMEVQTIEETHVLCLFSHLDTALALGAEIYALMPPLMNRPEKTGDQVYVDENDDILGEVDKFLVTSAELTIDELAHRVRQLSGLVIPAHVDRPSFSLTSQLGFVPEGDWDALELIRIPPLIDTLTYPLITSSDAHYPEHIGRRAFSLDIGDAPLYGNLQKYEGQSLPCVNIKTIQEALKKR